MFKIGEFSKLTQVSIRMLRHYDEVGIFKPYKVDSKSGYRLYSSNQIPNLNKIIYLRDSGFSIIEISHIMEINSDKYLIEKFNEKHSSIKNEILTAQEKLSKIEIAKKELLNNKDETHYNILVKSLSSHYVLSLRKVIPTYYHESELWKELSTFAKQEYIDIPDTTFSIYHDKNHKEINVDVELCVPVEKKYKNKYPFVFYETKAIPFAVCTMVYGDFSHISKAYLALAKWLQHNHQYKMYGPTRQIVHRGPWNEEDSHKYLTEIQIPVRCI